MSPETNATEEVLPWSFCHCLVGDKRIRTGSTESTETTIFYFIAAFRI